MSTDITPPEQRTFVDLPLDLQRTVIDYCIANRVNRMIIESETFELPNRIQITFRCNNQKCNEVLSIRFFREDVTQGGVMATHRCPKCKGVMYVSHKTAVLDYYLGPEKKKKLKGLEIFLFKQLQEDKEQYGPIIGDE